jgi:hypothetical protein
MRLSGYGAPVRDLLLRLTHPSKAHQSHRIYLLMELAMEGDEAAREALYGRFDPSDDSRVADAIVSVDGLKGLEWVLRKVEGLEDPDLRWRVGRWLDQAKEACGEDAVAVWLASNAADSYRKLAAMCAPEPKDQEPRLTFQEFRSDWWGHRRPTSVYKWIRGVTHDELQLAWSELQVSDDEDWLLTLARGLRDKVEEQQIPWLIERAASWSGLRNPFAKLLAEVTDPRVRALGLRMLSEGKLWEGLRLLQRNAESCDKEAVMNAAAKAQGDDLVHEVGFCLHDIGEGLRWSKPLRWTYENTPCSFCRESAVRRLIAMDRAPREILEECLYDCVADTREMAARALSV